MQINKPVSAIILFLLIALVVWFFVMPKYDQFGRVKVQLAEAQAEYEGKAAYYEKIGQIIKDIESRKDVLAKIDSSLPPVSAAAPIIYFLQGKASETGLLLKSLTYASGSVAPVSGATGAAAAAAAAKKAAEEKQVKDIMFTINLTGNYQGLKNFLVALEQSARLFEVESLTLTPLLSLQSSSASLTPSALQTYDFKLQIKTHTY